MAFLKSSLLMHLNVKIDYWEIFSGSCLPEGKENLSTHTRKRARTHTQNAHLVTALIISYSNWALCPSN